MPDFRESRARAMLVGCLCWLAVGCRGEAGAPEGRRADPSASRGTASVPTAGDHLSAVPMILPPAPIPSASAAASSTAIAPDVDCGGVPTAPLPRLEQRKLTAERKGQYRFELKYPLFLEDNEKVTQQLNRQFLEHLTAIQKRFVKEAQTEDHAPDPDNARWFEGKCEIAYHSLSFVSVACDTMEGPGAHPNLDKFAYNFQVCPDVRLVTLADLCRSLPDCRKKIVELINEDFRNGEKKETGIQFRDGPMRSPGEPPDMEHPVATLRTFGLTPTGLRVFLFDELPHVLQAFGVVDLPASQLRPVLREDVARRIWGP
jgi:hypothetical protein